MATQRQNRFDTVTSGIKIVFQQTTQTGNAFCIPSDVQCKIASFSHRNAFLDLWARNRGRRRGEVEPRWSEAGTRRSERAGGDKIRDAGSTWLSPAAGLCSEGGPPLSRLRDLSQSSSPAVRPPAADGHHPSSPFSIHHLRHPPGLLPCQSADKQGCQRDAEGKHSAEVVREVRCVACP
jgi:hypothetical protein